MTVADWKGLQREANHFTGQYLRGVAPLVVDGRPGRSTASRIMRIKFDLGYGRHRDAMVTREFLNRMRHPRTRKYFPKGMIGIGIARRSAQKARWAQQHLVSYLHPGVTRFDGVPVAKCAVPILQWCRDHGWGGHLVSGYRTPAYSEGLCENMCGAPSCPGRCAGRSTNHSGAAPDRFAVDVSEYDEFRETVAHCPLEPKIHNSLPIDPVHFSPSGR